MAYRREIQVTTRVEGFHSWPCAPEEVAFLRARHRHLFHVRIGIPVTHNDRDREFFIEQRQLMALLQDYMAERSANAGSCEMIAEFVLDRLPHVAWAEVSEDGENGARLDRESRSPKSER